jgi:Flp pilus assembly protein TadG
MSHSVRLSSIGFLKDAGATSVVEFAIVFPLFLILLVGIIIFDSYLAAVHGVQQLASAATFGQASTAESQQRFPL